MLIVMLVACAIDTEDSPRPPGGYRSSIGGIGGVEFQCEFVETDCPTDCASNMPPELGTPIYVVNGLETSDIYEGDDVEVRVPFSDPDANLGCGGQSYKFHSPQLSQNSVSWLCSNQPADSESSGVYLLFDLGAVIDGYYDYSVRIEDGCFAKSEWVGDTWTFD
jgi:hypothetical protein